MGSSMRYLIGIDDTDNLESRGTGFRDRCLGAALAKTGLARTDVGNPDVAKLAETFPLITTGLLINQPYTKDSI